MENETDCRCCRTLSTEYATRFLMYTLRRSSIFHANSCCRLLTTSHRHIVDLWNVLFMAHFDDLHFNLNIGRHAQKKKIEVAEETRARSVIPKILISISVALSSGKWRDFIFNIDIHHIFIFLFYSNSTTFSSAVRLITMSENPPESLLFYFAKTNNKKPR